MTIPTFSSNRGTIRNKIRRIIAKPSPAQVTDSQIDDYINTFYMSDMPEHLRLQNLKTTFQFTTQANVPVYDFPTQYYLTMMPPVYVAGYQSFMTQSRESFFRINPELNYLQKGVATGTGVTGPYSWTVNSTPILRSYKRNPPGAFAALADSLPLAVSSITWNVLISSTDSSGVSTSLVDDGIGNLWSPDDVITTLNPLDPDYIAPRGSVDYLNGIFSGVTFKTAVGNGNSINVQYIPYSPSRPQSVMFFNDQIALWPIPDDVYVISFEAFTYPSMLTDDNQDPQVKEWWQMIAYGASCKFFADSGDFDSLARYMPLLREQMTLCQRRTLVQQASERTVTIYSEQNNPVGQFPFGNLFTF